MAEVRTGTFLQLREPAPALLESYADALRRGWSPSSLVDSSGDVLKELEADPDAWLDRLLATSCPLSAGPADFPVDARAWWLWDDSFAGTISLRWAPGRPDRPRQVSGHIGYNIVPWRRGRGYATEALRTLLPTARRITGLDALEIITKRDNLASQRVIEKNHGKLAGSRGDRLVFLLPLAPSNMTALR